MPLKTTPVLVYNDLYEKFKQLGDQMSNFNLRSLPNYLHPNHHRTAQDSFSALVEHLLDLQQRLNTMISDTGTLSIHRKPMHLLSS